MRRIKLKSIHQTTGKKTTVEKTTHNFIRQTIDNEIQPTVPEENRSNTSEGQTEKEAKK